MKNFRFVILAFFISSCSETLPVNSKDTVPVNSKNTVSVNSKNTVSEKESRLSVERESLREYAFCSCLGYGYKDTEVYSDISIPILLNSMSYSSFIKDSVKEAAEKYVQNIEPSQVGDYNNKRAIILSCLGFYKSKELDSLIRSYDAKVAEEF